MTEIIILMIEMFIGVNIITDFKTFSQVQLLLVLNSVSIDGVVVGIAE